MFLCLSHYENYVYRPSATTINAFQVIKESVQECGAALPRITSQNSFIIVILRIRF